MQILIPELKFILFVGEIPKVWFVRCQFWLSLSFVVVGYYPEFAWLYPKLNLIFVWLLYYPNFDSSSRWTMKSFFFPACVSGTDSSSEYDSSEYESYEEPPRKLGRFFSEPTRCVSEHGQNMAKWMQMTRGWHFHGDHVWPEWAKKK